MGRSRARTRVVLSQCCGDQYCIQKYYLCRAAPRARDISVGGRAANDAE